MTPDPVQAGPNSTRAIVPSSNDIATTTVPGFSTVVWSVCTRLSHHSNSYSAEIPATKNKCGRSTDLSTSDYVVLLQEVLAAQVHVALHGAMKERFETFADALNSNINVSINFDAKSVRDHSNWIQRVSTTRIRGYHDTRSGLKGCRVG